MKDYFDFSAKSSCTNCVFCEMYDDDNTLCRVKEKWVVNDTWEFCQSYIQEGGSNE